MPGDSEGASVALVAITGAAGFLGTAITRRLARTGRPVRALAGPPGTPTDHLPEGIDIQHGLVEDMATVARLVDGATTVVHLAGPPSVAESYRRPSEYARGHVVGTAAVLEAMAAAGAGRLVHISSAEVYGRPQSDIVGEDHPTNPVSPYGVVKLAAESLARVLAPSAGVDLVVLRPFSVYGPGSPPTSLVGRLLAQARSADSLELADLAPVRDYVHVDDLAAAVEAALAMEVSSAASASARTFNIAGGVGYSVAQVAELVAQAAGRALPVRQATTAVDRPTGTDLLRLIADIRRADSLLKWVPRIALSKGLADAVAASQGTSDG